MSNMKEILKKKVKTERKNAHDILIETHENVNQDEDIKQHKKIKFEEQFTRQTYYINNELLEKLNKSAREGKGEKTRIINEALKKYFKNEST